MKIKAVIPTLGERTENLCVQLIGRQVDEVQLISGMGRWEAIYESWKAGLDSDILVLLPSDMLVYPGVVSQLIQRLGSLDRVSGKCHSKFRGMGSGGVSVYNTACLPRLMNISKNMYRNSIRPESEPVIRHLKYSVSDIHTGLHEYELDYREIYDRYKYQLIKHTSQVKRNKEQYESMAKTDKDYKAVLQAIENKPFDMGEKESIDVTQVIKKYKL